MSSFKSSDNNNEKKMGHTAVSALNSLISDPINQAKRAREKHLNFTTSNRTVDSKIGINPN